MAPTQTTINHGGKLESAAAAPAKKSRRAMDREALYTPGSREPAPCARPRLASANDVWLQLSEFHAAAQEHFVVFDLDVRHRVIAKRVVHVGTLTGVEVHPREVFRAAIHNAAAAIIIAHNHPSGDVTASRQDLDITQRLKTTGELVGIPVLDHIVFSADGYQSFADRGWI